MHSGGNDQSARRKTGSAGSLFRRRRSDLPVKVQRINRRVFPPSHRPMSTEGCAEPCYHHYYHYKWFITIYPSFDGLFNFRQEAVGPLPSHRNRWFFFSPFRTTRIMSRVTCGHKGRTVSFGPIIRQVLREFLLLVEQTCVDSTFSIWQGSGVSTGSLATGKGAGISSAANLVHP